MTIKKSQYNTDGSVRRFYTHVAENEHIYDLSLKHIKLKGSVEADDQYPQSLLVWFLVKFRLCRSDIFTS